MKLFVVKKGTKCQVVANVRDKAAELKEWTTKADHTFNYSLLDSVALANNGGMFFYEEAHETEWNRDVISLVGEMVSRGYVAFTKQNSHNETSLMLVREQLVEVQV